MKEEVVSKFYTTIILFVILNFDTPSSSFFI